MITTPLKVAEWEHLLRDHPDRAYVDYLLRGIRDGFRIGFSRNQTCRQAIGNMRSALTNPQPVAEFLQTELQAGRIIGPLRHWRLQSKSR